jgi:hypothetical protein
MPVSVTAAARRRASRALGSASLAVSTAADAGMVDPVELITSMVWLPIAAIGFGIIVWRFGRFVIASRHKRSFPALLALLAAFTFTPVPNVYSEYVPSALVWLGAFFLPSRFASSTGYALIACSIMTAALWSILLAAGKLSFRAAP